MIVLIVLAGVAGVLAQRAAAKAQHAEMQARSAEMQARRAEMKAAETANQANQQHRRADQAAIEVMAQQKRATALGLREEDQKHRASDELLHEAESTRLMANASITFQDAYDASLLRINTEAARAAATLDAQSGLLRRFVSHSRLSAFLTGHEGDLYGVAFSPDGKKLAGLGKLDKNLSCGSGKPRHAAGRLTSGDIGASQRRYSARTGRRLASAS